MTSASRPRRLHFALIGLLALVTYAPSLANGFALDDVPAVQQDERIRDLGNAIDFFGQPYLTYMPAARSPYRPVTNISYAVSWSLGDGHPLAFHATNVALHIMVSMLLLGLLTALGATALPATMAAAVFAVHPVHVEAVAGIVGRADLLSTLFCLIALLVHVDGRLPRFARVGIVAGLYLLALGSKEGAVVLPALILIVDAWRTDAVDAAGRGSLRRWVREMVRSAGPTIVAMSVPLAVFLSTRRAVLGALLQLDIASYIAVLPAAERVMTAVANLAHLARLLLFPLDLSPEYGPAVIMPASLTAPMFWVGSMVLVAAVGVLVAAIRVGRPGSDASGDEGLTAGGEAADGDGPDHEGAETPPQGAHDPLHWAAAGIMWIAAGYALVSNIVIPMPMWLAERTLYLPSVGVSLLVVACVTGVTQHHAHRARTLYGAIGLVVALGVIHSGLHSRTWANDEALFTDLVERHPESFRAQWWLGGALMDSGDMEGGARLLGQATALNPNSALLVLDYTRAVLMLGRTAEAEELARSVPAVLHPSRSVFLAQSLIFQGRNDEAAVVVREGLSLFPGETRLVEQARQLGIGG